jgi:hypothetical protein
MSFDFYLYRAPSGLGSLLEWEEDHAEPLGRLHELRDHIATLFPLLVWREEPDGSLSAQGSCDMTELCELSLRASQGEQAQFVVAYAAPPVLRQLMSSLQLNYCCAPESGELRNPFSVGASWDSA